MTTPIVVEERQRIAEAVRAACIRAAEEAYEQAATSGLCGEGALEAAIGALRTLDLTALIVTMPTRRPE